MAMLSLPTVARRSPRRRPASAILLSRRLVVAVAALGVIISGALAVHVTRPAGVYWSNVQVHFLIPRSAANPNVLQTSSAGLVITAGAVEKIVADVRMPRVIDPSSSLASQGVKHGVAVSLPNTGGQWANNFVDPWLEVQAVGSSVAEVSTASAQMVRRIDAALAELQTRAGVDARDRISTQLSPISGPIVQYMGGSRSRAGLAALALGFALTTILIGSLRQIGHKVARNIPTAAVAA
jgi:hypothetical protein